MLVAAHEDLSGRQPHCAVDRARLERPRSIRRVEARFDVSVAQSAEDQILHNVLAADPLERGKRFRISVPRS